MLKNAGSRVLFIKKRKIGPIFDEFVVNLYFQSKLN